MINVKYLYLEKRWFFLLRNRHSVISVQQDFMGTHIAVLQQSERPHSTAEIYTVHANLHANA